jgi:hypothetical protein
LVTPSGRPAPVFVFRLAVAGRSLHGEVLVEETGEKFPSPDGRLVIKRTIDPARYPPEQEVALGLAALEQGQALEAMARATHALAVKPDLPAAILLRGLVRMGTGDWSGAAPDLLAAVAGNAPGLDKVQRLSLRNRPITDRDLAGCERLTGIWALDLTGTKVTDEGMAVVSKMATLKSLSLRGTAVGDEGLLRLITLGRLDYLDLAQTGVTDRGLAALKGMNELQHLWVNDTKVTDAGLEQLNGLPKLEDVVVVGSAATPAAAAVFRGRAAQRLHPTPRTLPNGKRPRTIGSP